MDLRAEAATLPDAFARIALALFAAAVDPETVSETEVREVRAHGPDRVALLRRWLDECLYVHDVEGFACRSIEFVVFDRAPAAGGEALRLHAFLRGEPIDPARHETRATIRGIAAQGLVVQAETDGFRARATLHL
ncbi:MAG TPA: archease [Methylomirabilota bacterium]|nr:archease [Methylomirabilota bacterium]